MLLPKSPISKTQKLFIWICAIGVSLIGYALGPPFLITVLLGQHITFDVPYLLGTWVERDFVELVGSLLLFGPICGIPFGSVGLTLGYVIVVVIKAFQRSTDSDKAEIPT